MFRAFASLVFGAIAIGFANSFAPDYGRAVAAARNIFALLERNSLADNLSEDGHTPVRKHFIMYSCVSLFSSRLCLEHNLG